MAISNSADKIPISDSFLQELSALDSPERQSLYYVTFHPKKGFALEKKHSSFWVFSRVIDPVIRAWKSRFMNYDYSFEHNIKKISDCIAQQWDQIDDVQACYKSCKNLQMLANHVLAEQHKEPESIVKRLVAIRNEFLVHKAVAVNTTLLEIACRNELFDEAEDLIKTGSDVAVLSIESKTSLLGYFLNRRNIIVAERLIARGAEIKPHESKIFLLLPHFLKDPNSQLHKYFVKADAENHLTLVKEDSFCEGCLESIESMIKAPYLFRAAPGSFSHNIDKFICALQARPSQIQDVSRALSACERLKQIGDAANFVERLHFASYQFIASRAEELEITPLELVCQTGRFQEGEELINQGADIISLSAKSKNLLTAYYIESRQYEHVGLLMHCGAELTSTPEQLRPLLHFFLEEQNSERALEVLTAKAAVCPSEKGRDDSALMEAVRHGLLPVVKKLVEMGEDLSIRDRRQNSLLHIAAVNKHEELLEWLATKIDVSCKNESMHVAYSYVQDLPFFASKSQLEQAFLLEDSHLCGSILGNLDKKTAIAELNALRSKYPASYVDHILYSVNKSHYANAEQIALPSTVASGYSIYYLRTLFDQVNFSDPMGENYVNPADFQSDTGTNDPIKLKNLLDKLLQKVENREAFIGTPRAGSPALTTFYDAMQSAMTHTFQAIDQMPDSAEKQAIIRKTVVNFLRAASYCGGKYYANACQQYVAVVKGKEPTFRDEILEVLATYREVLFHSLVPQGQQSVHDFNYMMRHLGRELGIPGAEMMEGFEDIYIGEGVNLNRIRTQFNKLYTPRNCIFECVKQQLEQSSDLRNKMFDWFKENIPANWQQEEFKKVTDALALIPDTSDKVAYLESIEIYVAPGQTIEQALKDEREARYLALEVVLDMESSKLQIKPSAVAYMLETMGVLKAVYDWSYFEPVVGAGKFLASAAYQAFNGLYRGFQFFASR